MKSSEANHPIQIMGMGEQTIVSEMQKEKEELDSETSALPCNAKPRLAIAGAVLVLAMVLSARNVAHGRQEVFLPTSFEKALDEAQDPSSLAEDPRFYTLLATRPERVASTLNVVGLIKEGRYDRATRLSSARNFPKTSQSLELLEILSELLEEQKAPSVSGTSNTATAGQTLDQLISAAPQPPADSPAKENPTEEQHANEPESPVLALDKRERALQLAKEIVISSLDVKKDTLEQKVYRLVKPLFGDA